MSSISNTVRVRDIVRQKKGTLYHAIEHADPRAQHCRAGLLVKTLPLPFPLRPFRASARLSGR